MGFVNYLPDDKNVFLKHTIILNDFVKKKKTIFNDTRFIICDFRKKYSVILFSSYHTFFYFTFYSFYSFNFSFFLYRKNELLYVFIPINIQTFRFTLFKKFL